MHPIESNGRTKSSKENSASSNPASTKIDKRNTEQKPNPKSFNADTGGVWKCACDDNSIFLPQSMMKSLAGPASMLKLGAGGCYHKQM